MSVAAAYLVSEGVILGSDSSMSIERGENNGKKIVSIIPGAKLIFNPGNENRIGVATWGAGQLNGTSQRTIIARMADQLNEKSSIEDAAGILVNITQQLLKNDDEGRFSGYFIGGYNPQSYTPSLFQLEVRKDHHKLDPVAVGSCVFAGMPHYFSRIFMGYDTRLPGMLSEELKQNLPQGEIRDRFDIIFKSAFEKVSAPLIASGHRDLPISEAAEFVYSYLQTTINAAKYAYGSPVCAGPARIALIPAGGIFTWADEKSDQANLNWQV